jgi:toxin YoeB
MKNVAFTPIAFEEYNEWYISRPEFIKRIKELIRDIDRDAFKGIGKPEPLKGNWSGYCSRRIGH